MLRMGKISESVLRRSVFRLIHQKDGSIQKKHDAVIIADHAVTNAVSDVVPVSGVPDSIGMRGMTETVSTVAPISGVPDSIGMRGMTETVSTVAPVSGASDSIGMRGVMEAVNGLAAAGAVPSGVMLSLLLPPDIEEATLRQIVGDADSTCIRLGTEIIGGHTEVTDAVNRPVLSVTAIGSRAEAPAQKVHRDQDLVLTKQIALEASWLLAKEKRLELRSRFAADLIDMAERLGEQMSVLPEAEVLRRHPEAGVTAMYDVSRGGIFGALWEFVDAAGVGLDVDIRRIPIRQETVEICEFFDVNPYEALSGGSLLIASDNGEETVRILREAGISATVIGRTTEGPQRILHNGEEVRYLDRPQPDSLLRVHGLL
ncbi:MAG: AIR synthase related protein [Lachnospiraceae bacterium]|nr:AIR synthase related protein [Lachnospiraceae bacterium]